MAEPTDFEVVQDPTTGRGYVKGFGADATKEKFTPGTPLESGYGSYSEFESADAARNARIRSLLEAGIASGDWEMVGASAYPTAQSRANIGFAYGSGSGAMPLLTRPSTKPGFEGQIEVVYTDGSVGLLPVGGPSAGGGGGGGGGGGSTTTTTPSGGLVNPYVPGTEAFKAFQERESAYNLLYQQMAAYGLQALVEPLKNLVLEGVSPSEFTIRLRDTDAYKKRFAANAARINKGLSALSEAEYITLEDQYQNVMRNYGLPASYYARGDMGVQQGFEKFIAGDVSAAELEDRIQTAQNRVINAAPEVATSLREFYPEITGGDILAYALDPDKALTEIRRKVGAAEIGAGAKQAGLSTGLARAEELQRFGVTAEQARQGYQTIGGFLPRATQLSEIYAKQGEGPFTQTTAEQEVFGTTGAVEAQRKRRKLAELESAQFSGQVGAAGSALGRERAGQF